MSPIGIDVTTIRPRHFRWDLAGRVAVVTLNRPDRKNPLTFESYGELTETFRALSYVTDVRAVVVTGAAPGSRPLTQASGSSNRTMCRVSCFWS